jgi:periplasmic glucans biosynthesis protein
LHYDTLLTRAGTKLQMSPITWNRRDAVRLLVGGLSGPFAFGLQDTAGQTAPKSTVNAPQVSAVKFSRSAVTKLARELASRPYKPPPKVALGTLGTISQEDYARIRYKPDKIIWAKDKVGFAIAPLHPGSKVTGQMQINLVDRGVSARLAYDQTKFDFGPIKPPAANAGVDYSGFRILKVDVNGIGRPVASFQDASYYAAIARNQTWGLVARPVAVRSPKQNSEEAPQIRMVWIEKPSVGSNALVIHALVDMPSLAAAYHFTLRADDAAILDTECTIFVRTAVEDLALAPAQATYFAGALDRRNIDDVRPAVYEVEGAQILTGSGEWLWRPVANRNSLQISAFVDDNPRGFGLLQRDRRFEDFLDAENKWQRRPSLWIEPIGQWGTGEVTLIELPAFSQNNKNIALYWRPKPGLAAGSQTHYAYRQYWCWTPPNRSTGAMVSLSRVGRTPSSPPGARRRFLVQFTGGELGDREKLREIEPKVWASAGKVLTVRGLRLTGQRSYQVLFDLDPGTRPLVELRLVLELNGEPLSETWLYRWVR